MQVATREMPINLRMKMLHLTFCAKIRGNSADENTGQIYEECWELGRQNAG